MKEEAKKIILRSVRAACGSIGWTILAGILGLLQFLLLMALSMMVPSVSYSVADATKTGVFLFFMMAIVASLVLDYYFSSPRLNRPAEGLLFGLCPFIAAIFVTLSYGVLCLVDFKNVDASSFVNFNKVLFT